MSMGKHFGFTTTPPVSHPEDQYLADFLTDRAVDFIRRHRDRPFLLYLPHFGVHSPWEAKPAEPAPEETVDFTEDAGVFDGGLEE